MAETSAVLNPVVAPGKRVAIVTGGNQGIGFEIARALALAHTPAHTHTGGSVAPVHVIIGARDLEKGRAAAVMIEKDGGDVEALQLDITNDASVAEFAANVARTHACVDILINNAGFAFKGDAFGAVEARQTINTNFYGTIRITEALLPLLRRSPAARIVNVCSQAGRLGQVSVELQAKFQDPAATKESISSLMEAFIRAVEHGNYAEKGWPRSMYGISKLGEIAYTYVLARQLATDGIVVNAVCPGYCSTSMSSFHGERPPSKGAETPVWLALREGRPTDLTGGFWYDKTLISW